MKADKDFFSPPPSPGERSPQATRRGEELEGGGSPSPRPSPLEGEGVTSQLGVEVQEVKRHLDGREEVFSCEVLYLNGDVALLRFHASASYATDPTSPYFGVRVTEGYFWRDRTYLLYVMYREDGELLGYRFDVCCDVRIGPGCVEWTDLLLDLWVDPQSPQAIFLDEDEVADHWKRGIFTLEQWETVARTKDHLARHYRHIIQEARDLREVAVSSLGGKM